MRCPVDTSEGRPLAQVQKVYGDYDKSTIGRGRYSAGDQAELMTRSDADHGP
jgi:hypothetical protein